MECLKIKEKISAYIENQLTLEETKLIEGHLGSCKGCSIFLEDLKKTVKYAQSLGEVEPPPWLTQKVMAKVREETEKKKSILHKLFYPLHIKVPIEVFATIAVAVTALYMFRTIEPQMKVVHAPSEKMAVEEHEERSRELKKDESISFKDDISVMPAPSKRKSTDKAFDAAPGAYEETSPVPGAAAKRQISEKQTDTFAGKSRVEKAPSSIAGQKALPQAAYRAFDMKAKERSMAAAPVKEHDMIQDIKEDYVLTLSVEDTEKAFKETEDIIHSLGGEIIKTISLEDSISIFSRITPSKMESLFKELNLIGKLKEEDVLYSIKSDVIKRENIVKISIQNR